MQSDQFQMIGIDSSNNNTVVQSPEMISIKRPQMPSMIPRTQGMNILNTTNGIADIKARLEDMGISMNKIFYLPYSDGTMAACLFYCKTVHGQNILIEPPMNTVVTSGDLSLNIQRVGILPTNITEIYIAQLKNIHTGFAFISSGGIHIIKKKLMGQEINESLIYGFDDYDVAKLIFDSQVYHYMAVPFVQFNELIEPARLNTLEAYVSNHPNTIMDRVIDKTGLKILLTMKGPFTLFIPTEQKLSEIENYDVDRLRSFILAHIVMDRLDSDTSGETTSRKYVSMAANEVIVNWSNGVITDITSLGKQIKVHPVAVTKKYNGIIYRIDGVMNPGNSVNFQVPTSSDFDDVVTVFDINKTMMDIRRVQYDLNLKQHQTIFDVLELIRNLSGTFIDEILGKTQEDGRVLLEKSKRMMDLFYLQTVPCTIACPELDALAIEIQDKNSEYDRLLQISNRFASLKVPLEKTLLEIAKVDQRFHVPEARETE